MIALLVKVQHILPRHSLVTLLNFVRPDLNYDDVIYGKVFNGSFHEKLKSLQYNTALAMKGAIWETNTYKFYQEFRLESLQNRHKL